MVVLSAPKLIVQDVRVGDVWLECFPVEDREAVLSIACRSEGDGERMGIAVRLTRHEARELANYINRELA